MSGPGFVPGLKLAERFYREAVRPILDAQFSGLRHSAALIGSGSEVLGFDTPVSSDHHWGPRVLLFLDEADHTRFAQPVRESLRQCLPHDFLGWPTNFAEPDPLDHGTQLLEATTSGPVNHRVDVLTLRGFFHAYLGFDLRDELAPVDWLTFPSQKLRTIVGGSVFHDDLGLEDVRAGFVWYPRAVWLWQLAAGWKRISQEEHLMGRAGQVGDEMGSRLIAARLVSTAMRQCFLIERQYAPYPKWFGTAFANLEAAGALAPILWRVLRAEAWPERDHALAEVYSAVARMQNALELTDPVPTDTQPFFGRPFTVIFGERMTDALKARIDDPRVQRIPFDIGGIDQWSDSTDLVEATGLRQRVKALYDAADE
ncbi:MAG: DUF4037 domain-containing protein [Gemmatimonadota bacterium]